MDGVDGAGGADQAPHETMAWTASGAGSGALSRASPPCQGRPRLSSAEGSAMGSVVVCGGGVVVLCVAMMVARDGHEVTVLETDPDGAPATPRRGLVVVTAHRRRAVPSAAHPLPPVPGVSEVELPGLLGRLVDCWRRRTRGQRYVTLPTSRWL